MSHAEKCPVCGGTGKWCSRTCHGCNGQGWITVDGAGPPPPVMPDIDGTYRPWLPPFPPQTWIVRASSTEEVKENE